MNTKTSQLLVQKTNIKSSKPSWLKVKAPNFSFRSTQDIVKSHGLNTVCAEAACPNIGECWAKKHVTFMILGSTCTRNCSFCNIATGIPDKLDPHEPEKIARAVADLGLKHVVLTSVDRDDLPDGGANHFKHCVLAIRKLIPTTTIELLTPDFLRKEKNLQIVVKAKPDVFNHNIETVPSLYPTIRPGSRYFHSLKMLSRVKETDPTIFTKSGFMVGLGETDKEIMQLMDDLRSAEVEFVTIGQYLQPSPKHAPVKRFVTPEQFKIYAKIARAKGFKMVASSPLTRSSYHADEDFSKLKKAARTKVSTT